MATEEQQRGALAAVDKMREHDNGGSILFDAEKLRKINSGWNLIDGEIVLGFWLPSEWQETYETKQKDGTREKHKITKRGPSLVFVSSKRKYFLGNPKSLDSRNLFLQKPFEVETRWALNDIQAFLDGGGEAGFSTTFGRLKEQFTRYVEFPSPIWHDVVCLWVMATYFFPLFSAFGYLYFTGTKRAGKSKTADLIALTAFNAIGSGSVSGPALYRLVDSLRACLVLDEQEALGDKKRTEALGSLLLNGYKPGKPAIVCETNNGRAWTTRPFETYGPKVIANIEGIEMDPLLDRCIPITMMRSVNPAITNSEIKPDSDVWPSIRNRLYLDVMLGWEKVRDAIPKASEKMPDWLSARERELWLPIFTMAELVPMADKAGIEELAKASGQEKESQFQDSDEVLVLEAMESLVPDEGGWIAIKSIVDACDSADHARASDKEAPLNAKRIGRLLARLFGSKPGNRKHTREGSKWNVSVREYLTACKRFGAAIDFKAWEERGKLQVKIGDSP